MLLRKILVIKLRALGDTVLMTASLAQLRNSYPNADIHAAVLSTWAPILENHPAVDRVWTYERHEETAARAKAVARLALRLRREKYDAVIGLHSSPSSALMAFGTGARIRAIHFHGHEDKNLYSTVSIPGKGVVKPAIERDMDTVRAIGITVGPGAMPNLYVTESESQEAERIFRTLRLKGPILGLGIGASRPTKSWPLEKFAEAAITWCQKTKGSVLAIVGPGEEAQALELLHQVDQMLLRTVSDIEEVESVRARIKFQHRLSVRQLAATLSRLAVFLGNDSGPKHVAIAVGTPTVTLFGPEDPFEWHPYPRNQHPYFYREGLSCRKDADPGMPPWCGLDECVIEKHRCMTTLEVDPVIEKCQEIARLKT